MRLIDADLLKARTQVFFKNVLGEDNALYVRRNEVLSLIDNSTTIDPVKHGRWINIHGDCSTAECSWCGSCFEVTFDKEANGALFDGFKQFYKFCPNCGCRMDAYTAHE